MEAFLASTAVVTFAEIGDKTMLLAIVLATRFRAPLPIIAGIFAATLLNHALAAFAGQQVAGLLDAPWFRWAVALGFVAMALWTLVPDTIDEDERDVAHRGSVFLTTAIAFFIDLPTYLLLDDEHKDLGTKPRISPPEIVPCQSPPAPAARPVRRGLPEPVFPAAPA